MTEHILEKNGCPIHYWLSGPERGPLIVLTHGAGVDHRLFDAQVPALSERHRVMTWDVRGHGLSRPIGDGFSVPLVVDDLLAIQDTLGVSQAIYAGQSMGGNVAQELVRAHPERVRALVLIDCVCNASRLSTLERVAIRLTPAMMRLYPYDTLLRQSAKAAAIKPDVRAYALDAMKQLSREDLVTVMMATMGCLRDDPDYRIPCPFLLLRGEHDNAGAIARQAPSWSAREPKCRYVIVPDAGHCSNAENPEHVNRAVLEFLAEHGC